MKRARQRDPGGSARLGGPTKNPSDAQQHPSALRRIAEQYLQLRSPDTDIGGPWAWDDGSATNKSCLDMAQLGRIPAYPLALALGIDDEVLMEVVEHDTGKAGHHFFFTPQARRLLLHRGWAQPAGTGDVGASSPATTPPSRPHDASIDVHAQAGMVIWMEASSQVPPAASPASAWIQEVIRTDCVSHFMVDPRALHDPASLERFHASALRVLEEETNLVPLKQHEDELVCESVREFLTPVGSRRTDAAPPKSNNGLWMASTTAILCWRFLERLEHLSKLSSEEWRGVSTISSARYCANWAHNLSVADVDGGGWGRAMRSALIASTEAAGSSGSYVEDGVSSDMWGSLSTKERAAFLKGLVEVVAAPEHGQQAARHRDRHPPIPRNGNAESRSRVLLDQLQHCATLGGHVPGPDSEPNSESEMPGKGDATTRRALMLEEVLAERFVEQHGDAMRSGLCEMLALCPLRLLRRPDLTRPEVISAFDGFRRVLNLQISEYKQSMLLEELESSEASESAKAKKRPKSKKRKSRRQRDSKPAATAPSHTPSSDAKGSESGGGSTTTISASITITPDPSEATTTSGDNILEPHEEEEEEEEEEGRQRMASGERPRLDEDDHEADSLYSCETSAERPSEASTMNDGPTAQDILDFDGSNELESSRASTAPFTDSRDDDTPLRNSGGSSSQHRQGSAHQTFGQDKTVEGPDNTEATPSPLVEQPMGPHPHETAAPTPGEKSTSPAGPSGPVGGGSEASSTNPHQQHSLDTPSPSDRLLLPDAHPRSSSAGATTPPTDPIAELSDQIEEMADMLRGIANRRRSWQGGAVSRLKELVQRVWPAATVIIYGSYSTGLAIPASDIDVVICGAPAGHDRAWGKRGNRYVQSLNILANLLNQETWTSSVLALPKATVPIIKVQTACVPMRFGNRGVIAMDISFCDRVSVAGMGMARRQFAGGLSEGGRSQQQQQQLQPQQQHTTAQVRRGGALPTYGYAQALTRGQSSFSTTTTSTTDRSALASALASTARGDDADGDAVEVDPTGCFGGESSSPSFPSSPQGGSPRHQGIDNTSFVRRLCALHTSLPPLVIVLKQLLHGWGLSDTYHGGLGSYGLTIMVTAIVQSYALKPPEQKPRLGELLLRFFEAYGTAAFDTRRFCISLAAEGPLMPLAPPYTPRVGIDYWNPAPPVVILDPLNHNSNIARACFGFRQIQLCFDRAAANLRVRLERSPDVAEEPSTVLGVVFDAAHHRRVADYCAATWCPNDSQVPHTSSDPREQELQELGKAKNLTNEQTLRIQRLMRCLTAESQGEESIRMLSNDELYDLCVRRLRGANRDKLVKVVELLEEDSDAAASAGAGTSPGGDRPRPVPRRRAPDADDDRNGGGDGDRGGATAR